jgi:hypothetical protein
MRMKRVIMLFTIALFAFACGENVEGPNKGAAPEIVVETESPMWIDSAEGIYEIAYSIENPSTGLKLEAESNVDWASVVVIKDDAVSFVVQANTESSDRRGSINLKYGTAKASVTIFQHVKVDVNFEAKTTDGSVFTHCSNEAGVHSYFVTLSKEGVNNDGSFKHGAKYYCFDLCAKEVVSKDETEATIPNGTYSLSMTGELSDRAINYMYSYYVVGDN